MNARVPLAACLALLAGCAVAPAWREDVAAALASARTEPREVVVYFALRGREASDRMERSLQEPAVVTALAAGGFLGVIADGAERSDLYRAWIGGGEGMGIAVLDAGGRCYAARPGPQDPPELVAFLARCVQARPDVQAMRARTEPLTAPTDQHWFGCLLLELGCRVESEPLLRQAAAAGVADAHHRLARRFALDGDVTAARHWLALAPPTAAAQVTEGYVLFKERRHRDAIAVFETALRHPGIGDDRQRALLYLGKALHEDKQDTRAVPLLEALAAERTGSTFEAAALHTLGHIQNPQHGHAH